MTSQVYQTGWICARNRVGVFKYLIFIESVFKQNVNIRCGGIYFFWRVAYSVFRFEAKNFVSYNRRGIIMSMKELEKFMNLSPKDFIKRMRDANDKDWEFLDEALKKIWPTPCILVWAMQAVSGEVESNGNLANTACTILYKIFSNPEYLNCIDQRVIDGLLRISKNKDPEYKYARFRAACVVYLLGKSESPVRSLIKVEADFYDAAAVIREFFGDEAVHDFIENEVLA